MNVTDPHLSLVILCYRAGRDVVPLVDRMQELLSARSFSWELVLVGNYIDGSDDETPRVVSELARKWPNIRAVTRPKEGMMGWDMRTGLEAAQGTYVGVIDGPARGGRCLLAEGGGRRPRPREDLSRGPS